MPEADYFSLLGVPRGVMVDLAVLNKNYIELQNKFHPDKFVSRGEVEKKAAAQQSSLINEAYATLKNRFKRLEYLVKLTVPGELKAEPALLMEIMELREEATAETVKKLAGEIDELFTKAELDFKAGKLNDMAAKSIRIKYLNNVTANT